MLSFFCLLMIHFVYIIRSEKLGKYYVGFTIDVAMRLTQHNSGISTFTSKGIPQSLIHFFEMESIEKARVLEKEIKGRGIERYLRDKKII